MSLDHEQLTAVLLDQTDQLREVVRSADPTTPVPGPGAPGRTIAALVRHLAGGQRWATEVVTARSGEPIDEQPFRESRPGEPRAGELDTELAHSARALADALRAAGPDTPVWTPLGPGTTTYFARRLAHESVLHRADATLGAGLPWTLDDAIAVDALDECLELASILGAPEPRPELRGLLGPGRTVHLHATDTPADLAAEWVVDLSGDAPTWRRAHEKSAVAVRGPVAELLLLVHRRRSVADAGVEVFGDRPLLDDWLAAVPSC